MQHMQHMRRGGILLVLAMLATMVTVAPAAADPPVEYTQTDVFEDLNPCDPPNTHQVTITFNVKLHEHKNNTVLIVDSWATTDTGFEGPGHETTVLNKNNELTTFGFVQANPATGEKYTVKGNIKIVQGEIKVDNFAFKCIKDV